MVDYAIFFEEVMWHPGYLKASMIQGFASPLGLVYKIVCVIVYNLD